jgi:ATP-binding cassette, subfamily B, bacterial HlyB/CyaB
VRQDEGLSAGAFAWALRSMARLHRIPFAEDLALQQFPPPHTLVALRQAALALGIRTGLRDIPPSSLHAIGAPCLLVLDRVASDDDGPATPAGFSGESPSLALLLGGDAHSARLMYPHKSEPEKVDWALLESRYGGTAMLFAALSPQADPDDRRHSSGSEFGFKWFIPELLKHRHIWRDVLLASLAIQLLGLGVPLFTQVVIDKVIVHHTVNTLLIIAAALLVILVFNALMSWVRQYLVLHTGNRVDAVLGTAVLDRILKLPLYYHEERCTGVTVARVQGVEAIREFVSGAAVTLILDLPFLFIFLAIMLYYSWMLTLVAVAILLSIVALSIAVTPVLRERINDQFLKGARNQAFLTEYVAGMETVKSLQMEPLVKARFGEYLGSYLHAAFGARQLSNTYGVIANALEQLLTLSVLCMGAWLVMGTSGFTVGMLVAFQMFTARLSQPLLRMVGLWQEFQRAVIAVARLGDIMTVPPEPYAAIPSREGVRHGAIRVTGLGFRYGEGLPYVYRGLDLHVHPGTCVAITGASGSGKSTFAKLLQGFYQPAEGGIAIDGRDIRHLSANELRQYFGVVPQETVLFAGTVYENLALANPRASFEQIVAACKMAGIHDTVEQLPEAYQTKIGENGTGLSGGQKQRLAIARALVKRARILLFDEATSSVDRETAEQLAATINALKGRLTILFITHHVPESLAVDRVVALEAYRQPTTGETRVALAGIA